MTPRHACIRHIQEDEHKKLFQDALIQSIHLTTSFKFLEKYEKLAELLGFSVLAVSTHSRNSYAFRSIS